MQQADTAYANASRTANQKRQQATDAKNLAGPPGVQELKQAEANLPIAVKALTDATTPSPRWTRHLSLPRPPRCRSRRPPTRPKRPPRKRRPSRRPPSTRPSRLMTRPRRPRPRRSPCGEPLIPPRPTWLGRSKKSSRRRSRPLLHRKNWPRPRGRRRPPTRRLPAPSSKSPWPPWPPRASRMQRPRRPSPVLKQPSKPRRTSPPPQPRKWPGDGAEEAGRCGRGQREDPDRHRRQGFEGGRASCPGRGENGRSKEPGGCSGGASAKSRGGCRDCVAQAEQARQQALGHPGPPHRNWPKCRYRKRRPKRILPVPGASSPLPDANPTAQRRLHWRRLSKRSKRRRLRSRPARRNWRQRNR